MVYACITLHYITHIRFSKTLENHAPVLLQCSISPSQPIQSSPFSGMSLTSTLLSVSSSLLPISSPRLLYRPHLRLLRSLSLITVLCPFVLCFSSISTNASSSLSSLLPFSYLVFCTFPVFPFCVSTFIYPFLLSLCSPSFLFPLLLHFLALLLLLLSPVLSSPPSRHHMSLQCVIQCDQSNITAGKRGAVKDMPGRTVVTRAAVIRT